MTKRPLIGIVPLWDDKKQSSWVKRTYIEAIYDAGGIPIILPIFQSEQFIEELVARIDGLFLTGGDDIHPRLYEEVKKEACGHTSEVLDDFEWCVLKKTIEKGKPILGVCRGFQFINVYFNGSLFQDIESQYMKERSFSHRQLPPYDEPAHEVYLSENGVLQHWLGVQQLAVNSRHHQGIKRLGEGLIVEALAPDGLIEAVRHQDYPFLVAVQWHPELRYKRDQAERLLFERFVFSCQENDFSLKGE